MILECLCGGRNSESMDVSLSLLLTEGREPGFHLQHHPAVSGGGDIQGARGGRFSAYVAVTNVFSRSKGAALPGNPAGDQDVSPEEPLLPD